MYKKISHGKTSLNVCNVVEGEPLEHKIERKMANKEPIENAAPLLYYERQEGIKASTNIRTDRFEIAIEGMDKVAKSYKARREEKGKVIDLNNDKSGDQSQSEAPNK